MGIQTNVGGGIFYQDSCIVPMLRLPVVIKKGWEAFKTSPI